MGIGIISEPRWSQCRLERRKWQRGERWRQTKMPRRRIGGTRGGMFALEATGLPTQDMEPGVTSLVDSYNGFMS